MPVDLQAPIWACVVAYDWNSALTSYPLMYCALLFGLLERCLP